MKTLLLATVAVGAIALGYVTNQYGRDLANAVSDFYYEKPVVVSDSDGISGLPMLRASKKDIRGFLTGVSEADTLRLMNDGRCQQVRTRPDLNTQDAAIWVLTAEHNPDAICYYGTDIGLSDKIAMWFAQDLPGHPVMGMVYDFQTDNPRVDEDVSKSYGVTLAPTTTAKGSKVRQTDLGNGLTLDVVPPPMGSKRWELWLIDKHKTEANEEAQQERLRRENPTHF
jgi:hypothetical protein